MGAASSVNSERLRASASQALYSSSSGSDHTEWLGKQQTTGGWNFSDIVSPVKNVPATVRSCDEVLSTLRLYATMGYTAGVEECIQKLKGMLTWVSLERARSLAESFSIPALHELCAEVEAASSVAGKVASTEVVDAYFSVRRPSITVASTATGVASSIRKSLVTSIKMPEGARLFESAPPSSRRAKQTVNFKETSTLRRWSCPVQPISQHSSWTRQARRYSVPLTPIWPDSPTASEHVDTGGRSEVPKIRGEHQFTRPMASPLLPRASPRPFGTERTRGDLPAGERGGKEAESTADGSVISGSEKDGSAYILRREIRRLRGINKRYKLLIKKQENDIVSWSFP